METSNPKTFRAEPMKADVGTIVNFQLDVSPLAGLETGCETSLGQFLYADLSGSLIRTVTSLWHS